MSLHSNYLHHIYVPFVRQTNADFADVICEDYCSYGYGSDAEARGLGSRSGRSWPVIVRNKSFAGGM
jgi:hypothetical protein